MKATALIEQQHREVENLFSELEGGKFPRKVIEQIAAAILAHTVMEEQIFYPVAAQEKRQLVLECYEEHDVMAYALKRFVACDPADESFPARCKTLKALFAQHIAQEERSLLPAVAAGLPDSEQEALGRQMKARHDDLLAGGYEGALAARRTKRATDGHRARAAGSTAEKKKAAHHTTHRKAA